MAQKMVLLTPNLNLDLILVKFLPNHNIICQPKSPKVILSKSNFFKLLDFGRIKKWVLKVRYTRLVSIIDFQIYHIVFHYINIIFKLVKKGPIV